ncbi:MAG TPA: DUF3299 domain-containing protein [Saprospiraceae bacterium]|nr:DUF3299 domain-containing protein [Saprospiraceae bacterium]HMP25671.1 DUF3299 domain-containing protein [Saprospiraceae bacterium]
MMIIPSTLFVGLSATLLVLLLLTACGPTPDAESTTAAPLPAATDTVANALLAPVLEPVALDSSYFTFQDGYIELNWKILANVNFEEKYNDLVESYILYPAFEPVVQMLDGQPVRIRGYVIPIDETGVENLLVLSAFPFSNCFFCGNAGPESIMEVRLKEEGKRFKMDEQITFRGTLRLNDSDVYALNYILESAEQVGRSKR